MFDFFIFLILFLIVSLNILVFLGFIGFFSGAVAGAPFVPSGPKTVQRMIAFAHIKPGEKVYDLGCGDGRIVFAATKMGAHAVGVEISIFVYCLALIRKKFFHVQGEIRHESLWDTDISDADIIFVYLLPEMMKRFGAEKIPTLKKGARIISHGFALPGLEPQEILEREGGLGRILQYRI
ncbi:MAG: 50S ribosomal protein L11 methyltransferase [Candidatus Peregrinibacteria bacterium]